MGKQRRPRSEVRAVVEGLVHGAKLAELEAALDDLDEQDVLSIVQSKAAHEDVVRAICNSRFTTAYQVKLALVQNPKTPFQLVIKWMVLLRQHDLKALTAKAPP